MDKLKKAELFGWIPNKEELTFANFVLNGGRLTKEDFENMVMAEPKAEPVKVEPKPKKARK
jgi:hypothetical protein